MNNSSYGTTRNPQRLADEVARARALPGGEPEPVDYSSAPYLAMAPNYFGRGFTVDEAKANLKKAGGKLTQHFVYRMPEGATKVRVNGVTGGISWTWAEGADTTGQPEIVASRGIKR